MSFSSDLKRFQKKFEGHADEFIASVEIALFSAVVMDSPVDTGRFRANWQVSLNASEAAQSLLAKDKSGRPTISKMTSYVDSLSGGRVTYFTNNLPYAVPLEYGYSGQSPQGMVRKNAARFQRIVSEQL